MDNLELILDEFEKLKGQFVIILGTNRVERLIAIGDDTEDWFYLTWDGRNVTWNSCVMRLIPLKGCIREEDYQHLVELAKLNDYDQRYSPVEWQEEWNKQRMLWGPNHSLLTLICWDLL